MNKPVKPNESQSIIFARTLRRFAGVLFALLFFCASIPAARAEQILFPIGACSDEVLRVETRLSDLGYTSGVVNGLWEQADADALAAFSAANGVTTVSVSEALFSSQAVPAAQQTGGIFAVGASGFALTYGSRMPWDEVKPLLQPGTSYNVTSCYSSITLHMVCVSTGAHAKFRPELEWDDATLRGFFTSASSSEKQPIVVTINGVLVAASIQQAAPNADAETGALPEYSVYFRGALSEINGIPDAEHEAVIEIASSQP
jgi:hypothetical protein